MQLAKDIIEATTEIFNTMVMMEIAAGEPHTGKERLAGTEISGMIGLAGAFKGMLAIHLPAGVAKAITGNFLGMQVDELNADVQDAIGEVANMLGGSVKGRLAENGRDIELSLPSTVCGKNYSFKHKEDVELVVVPFATADGEFLVELQIQGTKATKGT